MTQRERELFGRVQVCIGAITNLCPSNHASLARKVIVSDCMASAGRSLYHAIACIGFGDMAEASQLLSEAEAFVTQAKTKSVDVEAKHFARQ